MCEKDLIPLVVNYYNQIAKAFVLTKSKLIKTNLLVFDPLKTQVSLQSSIDYELGLFFEKKIMTYINKKENKPYLSKMMNALEEIKVEEILPMYCNIFEIWLAAKYLDLDDEDNVDTIHKKTFSLATTFFEPYLFYFNPTEHQVNKVKKYIGDIKSSTIKEFISTLSKLFLVDSRKNMNFVAISFSNSDCYIYGNCGVTDLIQERIGEFEMDLSCQMVHFFKKKIDKLDLSLFKLFEEKLKTVDIFKLLAFISPLFVFFVDFYKCFKTEEKKQKFFNFVYLISFNTLTNPIIQKIIK